MCKIDWEILHNYVDTLIWPVLFIVLLLLFKKHLINLIRRITEESEKIEIPGILVATLKNVEQIKRKSKETGEDLSGEVQRLISSTVLTQIETIKKLGEEYIHASYDQRRILESRIKEYSIGLEVDDIEPLFESTDTGHRIAAAMVLETILYRQNFDPFEKVKVRKFLIKSIEDSNSFLRYEALQIILSSDKATNELKEKLNQMSKTDKNSAIRSILNIYMKNKKN